MNIKEIQSKSILTTTKLPESDYCINPYVGCMHGCVYCYARFMKRFTNHTEPWGEFLDVKINAVQLLKKKLNSMKYQTGIVLLSSVTDAYQPIERKYKLTRNILKELVETDFEISILTKSDLVVRDMDILKECKSCSVGFSISMTDDNIRKKLEPYASSIPKRIEALRQLHENGIPTYAFVGPILPGITNLHVIFESVHNLVDNIWGEVLNVTAGNWSNIEKAYQTYFPKLLPDLEENVKNFAYWSKIENEFRNLCENFNIPLVGFYRH